MMQSTIQRKRVRIGGDGKSGSVTCTLLGHPNEMEMSVYRCIGVRARAPFKGVIKEDVPPTTFYVM